MPDDTDLEHPLDTPADGTPPITPPEEEADDAVDLISIVETDAKGRKVVGLDKLIDQRKASRDLKREVAALKAQIADHGDLRERLDRVQPIADAVEKNPALAAQIRDALAGTRPTRSASEQPEQDEDALAYAEIHSLVTKDKDGTDVWDAARARRALDLEAKNAEKRIRPYIEAANEAAFGLRGEQNLSAMYGLTTKSGEPLASEESIREIMRESNMPLRMLADPRVAKTVARMAAGLDREEGRTPKVIEPLFFERAGGRRGDGTGPVSDEDRRAAKKLGLSEQDLTAAGKKTPNRRGEIDLE